MDYALVINAGSSSLKFCVYRGDERKSWQLEARGQIEGIGSAPKFSAKNAEGVRIDERELDRTTVRDGHGA